MSDVTRWESEVNRAVSKLSKGMTYEDKQDLKQDCYMALLEASDYLAGLDNSGAVAYTIAYNRIVEQRRDKSLLDEALPLDEMTYEEKGDEAFMRGVLASPTEQGLDAAVESLPKTENFIIRSLYFKGMTERDVAKSVNKSRHWVRMEKAKAVDILKKYFEER
jgi:RNA polymerase sigma factor (sigma-70 family)